MLQRLGALGAAFQSPGHRSDVEPTDSPEGLEQLPILTGGGAGSRLGPRPSGQGAGGQTSSFASPLATQRASYAAITSATDDTNTNTNTNTTLSPISPMPQMLFFPFSISEPLSDTANYISDTALFSDTATIYSPARTSSVPWLLRPFAGFGTGLGWLGSGGTDTSPRGQGW